MAEFNIRLGEIGVRVDASKLSMAGEFRERYRNFSGKNSPAMTIVCRSAERKLSAAPPVRFARTDSTRHLIYLAGGRPYGSCDLAKKRGELNLPDGPASVWGYLQAHFLMGVYAELLLPRGGFLLHASSTQCAGRGLLFAADSGGGKSTIAKMPSWEQVFSDDVTLVFKKGKLYFVEGTPWGKPAERGTPAKIGACFFLKKAKRFGIRKVSPTAAGAELFRLSARMADSSDFDKMLLQAVGDFAEAVPAFELSFARGSALPRLLSEALT